MRPPSHVGAHGRRRLPVRAPVLAPLLVLLAPAASSAQGLTLRLAPEAQAVRWDEGVGLADATFVGGGLSLGFGRYLTLRGGYATAGTLETAFGDAGFLAEGGGSLDENRVRTSLFDGSVLLRLGAQRVAPVLAARGGILSLEPEGRERARQILAGFGGGLDLRLAPWLDGQIRVERLLLRMDRALLTRADALPAPDPERSVTRSSLAVGASLGMRLGAGRASPRADGIDAGFGSLLAGEGDGVAVPLELLAGVMRFDDALGLPDQRLAGVRGGLDLGPYFGVRGSYWRGVTDGFDAVRGVSGWSGEFQFNVGPVTGAAPHLIVGAGQTRFTDDFLSESEVTLERQNQLILGAGLGLPLGERARLSVTLRDHMSAAGDLRDASAASDLRHSLSLTAGLSFLLAGRGTHAPPPPARSAPEAEPDSTDYRSDQILAIPLPKEGELYVRYGPGGRTLPAEGAGPDSAAVGLAVVAEVARLVEEGRLSLTDSARAALEARVLERLAATAAAAGDSATPLPDSAAAGRAATPSADPEVAALRRQVDELTRLVRESLLLQATGTVLRPQGGSVTVVGAPASTSAPGDAAEPFLRSLEGRFGRAALDGEHGGLALGAEAYVGSLRGDEKLVPFLGLAYSRHSVRTEADGSPVRGNASVIGMDLGVTRVLPNVGPIWPTLSLLLATSRTGVSASSAGDEAILDRRWGGLALGPGIALGVGYRPDAARRTLVTGALRKSWAGSASRWSAEVGMRLTFSPRSGPREVGPFSVQPTGGAPAPRSAADSTAPPADPAAPAGGGEPPTALADTADALRARLDSLEARVLRETEARQRAQARADSLAAAAAAEARARERAAAEEEARRAAWRSALDSLEAASSLFVESSVADGLARIVLGGDLFPVGATEPAAAARAQLEELGRVLAGMEPETVLVEGHTDSTGTAEANLTISRMRAEAVRRALLAGGVPAGIVTSAGAGQERPVADNATRDGRARNRRVEVQVRMGGGAP